MSERIIKPQCETCVFKELCETPEGQLEVTFKATDMAIDGIERFAGCRHPWRVFNDQTAGRLTELQAWTLSRLVEIRGKDPAYYGLADSTEISTQST